MNARNQFSIVGRFKSIRLALRGVRIMLITQHNAWVHLAATIIAVAAGLWLGISPSQWCWITIACVTVWTAEALNTALELLCDVAAPGFHPLVEQAKDVAAGGVLISAIGALFIGALVFTPYLAAWWNGSS